MGTAANAFKTLPFCRDVRYSKTYSLCIFHSDTVQCSVNLPKMCKKYALWPILRWEVIKRDAVEWSFACTQLKKRLLWSVKDLSKHFRCLKSLLKVFERVKMLCLRSHIPGDGAQRRKTAGNALPELVCAKGAARLPGAVWLRWAAPVSCPPGRFHPSGCGTAAGTQPGRGHPAGEWHQGQGAAAGAAHRCQEGRHQVGGAAAAERPQCRRAVQGNGSLGQLLTSLHPHGETELLRWERTTRPISITSNAFMFVVLSCTVTTKCSFLHVLVMPPIFLVTTLSHYLQTKSHWKGSRITASLLNRALVYCPWEHRLCLKLMHAWMAFPIINRITHFRKSNIVLRFAGSL